VHYCVEYDYCGEAGVVAEGAPRWDCIMIIGVFLFHTHLRFFFFEIKVALLVIRHSGFRFRYCTALLWEDSNNWVFIYTSTAALRSYYIILFVYLLLLKLHGIEYNHALVDYSILAIGRWALDVI
jgi:hypothetical protein